MPLLWKAVNEPFWLLNSRSMVPIIGWYRSPTITLVLIRADWRNSRQPSPLKNIA